MILSKKKKVFNFFKKYFFILLGALITAFGLEAFLIPNNIIDGGVVGISIILSHVLNQPLGIFIVCLNLPFLFFGYKQIGLNFVITSLVAVASLALFVTLVHDISQATNNVLLASVFGGIIIGIGVGLIIRYGGSLDGTEIVAIAINEKSIFSVGQTVMFFNVFILLSAGFVFTWDSAMYSLLTYFIAFKMIDITIEGLDEAKAAIIITDKGEELAKVIGARLGRSVTFLDGMGSYSKSQKHVLYSVISRLELSKLKSIIAEVDDQAFFTINDVSDVMGGKYRKKGIH